MIEKSNYQYDFLEIMQCLVIDIKLLIYVHVRVGMTVIIIIIITMMMMMMMMMMIMMMMMTIMVIFIQDNIISYLWLNPNPGSVNLISWDGAPWITLISQLRGFLSQPHTRCSRLSFMICTSLSSCFSSPMGGNPIMKRWTFPKMDPTGNVTILMSNVNPLDSIS